MIEYRPFLNTDPPLLTDVWRSQPPLRGRAQAVSSTVLEKHVFSKSYFDRFGFIVAVEENRIVGFAHAGFGPNDERSSLANQVGVISRLMVVPHEEREEIANRLLQAAEQHLIDAGVSHLLAGGWSPASPFYLGLYGGSRLPGILRDDLQAQQLFLDNGYAEVGRQEILQCRLAGFRPVVNRQQITVRRKYQIKAVIDPMPEDWWDACTLGVNERTRFLLTDRRSGEAHGRVTFWDMEPLASNWGVHAMGLLNLYIDPPHRRQGLATFLVGESLRQLQSQGNTLAEVQVPAPEKGTLEVFAQLGFEAVDQGVQLSKDV